MNKNFYHSFPFFALFVFYLSMTSSSGGITGVSSSGCSCNNASANANTLFSVTGLPSNYVAGSIYTVTITVTNSSVVAAPTKKTGFDMTVNLGSFTNAPANATVVSATEIRHNTPNIMSGNSASWTFNWTAPAAGNTTPIVFNVACNIVNGDGGANSFDQWNKTTVNVAVPVTPLSIIANAGNIACNGDSTIITCAGLNGTATSLVITQPVLVSVSANASSINVCNGNVVTLFGSNSANSINYSYSWSNGVNNNIPFVANSTNTYTVTGVNTVSGCSATLVVTVSVNGSSQLAWANSLNANSIIGTDCSTFTQLDCAT